MKPTSWLIVAVVALLTLPAACRHAPVTHYYVLDGPMDGPHRGNPVPARDGLAIGVAPFVVDPPYDQDRLVYRLGKDAAEVRFYSYHRWAAPLSRMLPLAVARAFGGAAGLSSIEPAAPGRDYPAVLEGRLIALEEIDTPGGQTSRVQFELTLRGEDGRVVWSGRLEGEAATRTKEVDEIVEAMRSALGTALEEARGALERALSRAHFSPGS